MTINIIYILYVKITFITKGVMSLFCTVLVVRGRVGASAYYLHFKLIRLEEILRAISLSKHWHSVFFLCVFITFKSFHAAAVFNTIVDVFGC